MNAAFFSSGVAWEGEVGGWNPTAAAPPPPDSGAGAASPGATP